MRPPAQVQNVFAGPWIEKRKHRRTEISDEACILCVACRIPRLCGHRLFQGKPVASVISSFTGNTRG